MASIWMDDSNEYRNMLQARKKQLEGLIEKKVVERDAVDAEIAAARSELEHVAGAYRLSGGAAVDVGPNSMAKKLSGPATANVVVEILQKEGKSLHYREICEKLKEWGVAPPDSEDPASAFLARYYDDPRLHRLTRGTYSLNSIGDFPSRETDDIGATRVHVKPEHPKPVSFTLMGKKRRVTSWIDLLRRFCEELYDLDEDSFRALLSVESSRGNPYFSLTRGEYRGDWEIPGSGIFVVGGLNRDVILKRCKDILQRLGIDPENEFAYEEEPNTD